MKKLLTFLVVGLLLVVLQAMLKTLFGLKTGPELPFIFIVFSGVYHRPFGGLLLAFGLGLVMDALWGLLPGLYAALYPLAFMLCRIAGRRFHMRSILFQILLVVLMTLAVKTVQIFFLGWVDARSTTRAAMFLAAWPVLAWNAAFAVPTVGLLEWVEKTLTDEYATQFVERRGIL